MDSQQLNEKRQKFFGVLADQSASVSDKYKALFELKTLGGEESTQLLIEAYPHLGDSELLKHELVYVLGQMRNIKVLPFLLKVLNDENEQPIARHEAGEGVAYFNDAQYIPELEKYVDSQHEELRDTCRLGLRRLKDKDAESYNGLEKYGFTLEPAPGFKKDDINAILEEKYGNLSQYTHEEFIAKVLQYILDPSTHLYLKYKGLYFLRDQESEAAVKAMGDLLDPKNREATGALLRHEVCFALGELSEKGKILKARLEQVIGDDTERAIVRHEAISAYSSCCNDMDFIRKFCSDPAPVVKESALVAIDLIDYWAH